MTYLSSLYIRLELAARALRRDTRGAAMVEYTVIIGGVALASMVTFVILGLAFAQSFAFLRQPLFYPVP